MILSSIPKVIPVSLIILIFFSLLALLILYYIATSKKRREAFYQDIKGWKEEEPRESQIIKYSVFLIGDAGAPSLEPPEPTLEILRTKLLESGKNSAVFFLGDNIYPRGMPKPSKSLHKVAEERLLHQLKILNGYSGKIIFISGNHDWNKGRKNGWKALMRQQAYIDNYFKNEHILLPRNGCPGPYLDPLTENLTAVIINTQWWVQSGFRPIGKHFECLAESEEHFFRLLKEALEKNRDKHLLVIGHHPMFSRAYHGGVFTLKQHLFPLTALNKKMYLPLPLVGSLYPMYRKYIGSKEDMAHPIYRKMRKKLISIFEKFPDLIYAAGHDHNLQYIRENEQHYIISGAGCKANFVEGRESAVFTHAHKGFFRLDYYTNGDIWMEVWEPDHKGSPVLAFRKEIHDNDEPYTIALAEK